MKWIAAVGATLMLAACTTTAVRVSNDAGRPPPGAKILLVQPDVELSLLTVSGIAETKADWSATARGNLASDVDSAMSERSLHTVSFDPTSAQTGRVGQLLRLNSAVGESIMLFNYAAYKLPTHESGFDWTLGDGTKALADAYGADYALFITARGTYASDGRKALAVGAALLGVSVPLGHQYVYASLVNLHTGKVVWFNIAVAGPDADMRDAQGARSLVASVLKDAPL